MTAALFSDVEEAIFRLGQGNSPIASVTGARLRREHADALLDYIARLETDVRPAPQNQVYARMLGAYPDLKPKRDE